MSDYEGARARWCPGCGDHSILTAVQRLLAAEQLAPEQTVFVSGIGCSSRFPHYLKTYGFHGIHGRALAGRHRHPASPARSHGVRGDGRRRLHVDRRRPLDPRPALQPRPRGAAARQRHLRADQEADVADHAAGIPEQHAAARQLASRAEPALGGARRHQRVVRRADGGVGAGAPVRDAARGAAAPRAQLRADPPALPGLFERGAT